MPKERQTIGYEAIPKFVAKVTEIKLGELVPQETMKSWIVLARAMRIIDSIIDRPELTSEARTNLYQQVIDFLKHETDQVPTVNKMFFDISQELRSRLDLASPRNRELFIRDTKKIFRATELKKDASSPRDLARMTMLESQISMRMFLDLLPDHFNEINGYREYLRFSTRSARAASMVDAGIDFTADYNQRQIEVEPSMQNKVEFALTAAPEFGYVMSHVSPGLFIDLVREAKNTIAHRNSQRHLDSLSESIV